MARINKTRFAILGMLTTGPKSGYDIKKDMQQSTNYFWSESDGQLYPILHKLAQEKLVTVSEEVCGARPRKVYTITKTGEEALKNWLAVPPEAPTVRFELLLKLFFGRNAPIAVSIEHVQHHQQEMLQSQQLYTSISKHIEQEHSDNSDAPFWLITLRSGMLSLQAELAWCNETLKILKKLKNK